MRHLLAVVNERCFGGSQNIYGLAIPVKYSQRLSDEVAYEREPAEKGEDRPIWTQPLQGDEVILGYDVLCYNYGWTTFQCNNLQDELFGTFGVRLNEWSLIPNLGQAEALAGHSNQHNLGEPGWWGPYAVLLPAEEQYRLNQPLSAAAGQI